ncbi:predicted protein [Plenodomus lingam JN3]|uniref:Predicted protein n=1 Tax=Leptosphaeria maculans (strain JN3 / isolate v23.1.3 / race Av1-4-5-6-7-8) TaxID=985895 RepID=E4ZYZ4_LEPMJ|nr:predicted protein [Plenodomus lingam JN3]CBX96429.1 predicted protein [Plenodomus lingam JN3]
MKPVLFVSVLAPALTVAQTYCDKGAQLPVGILRCLCVSTPDKTLRLRKNCELPVEVYGLKHTKAYCIGGGLFQCCD